MVDQQANPRDWSLEEVDRVVIDYFTMLRQELFGEKYSKAEHWRTLISQLDGRSKGAIEFKHQNISAVLIENGWPYIYGYKPVSNYQQLLADRVLAYLDEYPQFLIEATTAPLVQPVALPHRQGRAVAEVLKDPPEQTASPLLGRKPWLALQGRFIDFARRDAQNRALGRLGEEFALWFERQQLIEAGCPELADRVRWVADEVGDVLGFDILSFAAEDGKERYVEVKTTGLGKYFPFYVTDLERRCSEDTGDRFRLLRVFDVGRSPQLFVLTGSLSATCELTPTVYQARIARGTP